MFCAYWQATKTSTPPWVFFTFFNLYIWQQIAKRITFIPVTYFMKRRERNLNENSTVELIK